MNAKVIRLSIILMFLSYNSLSAQSADRGHLYVLRPAEYYGWAIGYPVFVDDIPVCRVNNKKFTIQDVLPGKHKVKIQMAGKSSDKNESIEVEVEMGKDYYFQVISERRFMTTRLYLQEITEKSAKKLISDLEKDMCL